MASEDRVAELLEAWENAQSCGIDLTPRNSVGWSRIYCPA